MSHARTRILVKKPGGFHALVSDKTPIEEPSPGEVLVEVKACGINFADTIVRKGLYAAARGKYPVCPGLEFSGIVKDLGDGIANFCSGDRVFGVTRFGGYTSAINVSSEHLWKLPDHWDFLQGATFPVVYLTAYYGLYHIGHLRSSDAVLVHSAAGGVGTALLHLLRINGNEKIVGVVGRSEKISPAENAGTTHVIDKSSKRLWETAKNVSPEGFDLILDANGAATLRGSYEHLKPAGRLLIYGFASMLSHSGSKNYPKLLWNFLKTPRFNPLDLTGANKTISGFNLIYLFSKVELFYGIMDKLVEWDAAGKLPPMPITAFPFEEAAKAHAFMESGKSIGKLALTVSPNQ